MSGQSRREFLVAAGVALAALPFSKAIAAAARRSPTPANPLGPFYRAGAPQRTKLIEPGDPGLPLEVAGLVIGTEGEPLPEATIEIFHADARGDYDRKGFRYRAAIPLNRDARYEFETVMPGHYTDPVVNPNDVRPEHIHFVIKAPGHKRLNTQLYFETDPFFEGDPEKNYHKDPLVDHTELIRPVMLFSDKAKPHARVEFTICLERS